MQIDYNRVNSNSVLIQMTCYPSGGSSPYGGVDRVRRVKEKSVLLRPTLVCKTGGIKEL